MLIRPADKDADVQEWLRRLRSLPDVEYVHPNTAVHILSLTAGTPPQKPPMPSQAEEAPERAVTPAASTAKLAAAAAPVTLPANDPELPKQLYLNQIGAKKRGRPFAISRS